MANVIKNKQLKNALASLILRNTFFSALLLQQNFVESSPEEGCETMDIDGETLRYNTEYINSLTFDETKGALGHAAMHLALAHPNRMGNRDGDLWDEACDHAVNSELTKKSFKLPKTSLKRNDSMSNWGWRTPSITSTKIVLPSFGQDHLCRCNCCLNQVTRWCA